MRRSLSGTYRTFRGKYQGTVDVSSHTIRNPTVTKEPTTVGGREREPKPRDRVYMILRCDAFNSEDLAKVIERSRGRGNVSRSQSLTSPQWGRRDVCFGFTCVRVKPLKVEPRYSESTASVSGYGERRRTADALPISGMQTQGTMDVGTERIRVSVASVEVGDGRYGRREKWGWQRSAIARDNARNALQT